MQLTGDSVTEAVQRMMASGPGLALLRYQQDLLEAPARFTWSCWARQTGKSTTLSLRRMMRGIARRRTQLFLSAGMRQCRELVLKVQQHCQAYHIAGDIETDLGENGIAAGRVRLPHDVRVIALPARPETIRGFSGDVLLDEFAMHGDDRAIWAAIFPTILRSDGELDIASTPKGKGNLFYKLGQNESFARTVLTLPQAIEQGLDLDIEELRRAMGDEELFRQEFLCEFLDESEAFLPYRVIAGCEDGTVAKQIDWQALQTLQADVYVGVDVARRRDLTVVWLWRRTAEMERQRTRRHGDAETRREAEREIQRTGRDGDTETRRRGDTETRRERERGTGGEGETRRHGDGEQRLTDSWALRCVGVIELAGAPFAEQREVIERVLQLRCVRRCCMDATGMGWPLAEWAQDTFGQGRVEAVVFTAGLKAQMASQLRRLAEEGRLRIPAEDGIRNDWHSVRRSTNASGGLRLDAGHDAGGHADRFWAAALGVYAADNGPAGVMEYSGAGQLRFARRGTW